VTGGVAGLVPAPRPGGRRREPKYDFMRLMRHVGVMDMPAMAAMLGVSVNVVRNWVQRGITWSRADEAAIRCGVMPWEVWPEWADADPADWMGPSCPAAHGYDYLVPYPSRRGEYCAMCVLAVSAGARAAERAVA
jgi:hypothetical protein